MKNIQTKPKIHLDLNSPDGNIFSLLAHAENALKAYNIVNGKRKATEMRTRVTSSGGYKEALEIIREYVVIL